jgi:hypothetical protein
VLLFIMVYFLLAFPPKSYNHFSSPYSCYMPCSSHTPRLGHSNYTWRGVQVMKIFIMQFPPTSFHFIPTRREVCKTKTAGMENAQSSVLRCAINLLQTIAAFLVFQDYICHRSQGY